MAQTHGQLSIDTPELVTLEMPVAGFGSRSLAVLLDYFLQGLALTVLLMFLALFGDGSSQSSHAMLWAWAFLLAVPFLMQWGYFTLFEAFWRGQTPGKRVMKLRVITSSGRPLTLFESLTRNFIRFVDLLPGFYLVGIVSVLVTQRQQRLGDLAAGTLVIHDLPAEEPLWGGTGARTLTASSFEPAPAVAANMPITLPLDQLAKLSLEDVRAIENFLARRLDLPLDTRGTLAQKLAARVTERTGLLAADGQSAETFLEHAVAGRRSISAAR